MKLRLTLFVLLFSVGFGAAAQIRLTASSVILDSANTRLSPPTWQRMLGSREYTIMPVQGKENTYILVKLSPEQKVRMMAEMKDAIPPMRPSPFFKVGEEIKAFTVKDLRSKETLRSKDLLGKVIVLNFWFINCLPCRDEMPELNELVKKYADDPNIVFIGMALDSPGELQSFLKKTPFDYRISSEPSSIRNKFRVSTFPTNVVVGKDGKVTAHTSGGLSGVGMNWLKKSISDALAASLPESPGTN